jgi:hypothetical protein
LRARRSADTIFKNHHPSRMEHLMRNRANVPPIPQPFYTGTVRRSARLLVLFFAALIFCVVWPAAAVFGQSQQSQSNSQTSSQAPAQPAVKPAAATAPVSSAKPPSLADAARIARADHAKEKPAHVFTNDNMSSVHGTISVVGSSSSGVSDDSDDSAGQARQDSASSSSQQEQYWRSQANAIKYQIDAVDRQIAQVKDEVSKQGAVSFDPSAGLSQGVIIVHDRNAEIKNLEDRKRGLEKQLDDLADSARKAGADPGWVR